MTTIGIITADRPAALRRCLASFSRHCKDHGREPRFVIVDGSRRPDSRAANRKVIQRVRAAGALDARYVGLAEAAELRRRLASTGISQRTLAFALTPGPPGANRNLLTLVTAGERLLTADDDVVCRTWMLDDASNEVAIGGHTDRRDIRFFTSRSKALAATAPAAVDLLGAHGSLLGQSLGSIRRQRETVVDLRDACDHLRAPAGVDRARVRVTSSGLAGDAGIYCRHQFLFAPEAFRDAYLPDARTLRTALTSREVVRVATRTLVMHGPSCMAACMGLDNRTLLPPFMPIGRSEDGVFAATLASVEPSALFAHLPHGIVHDSNRPAPYGSSRIASASQTRLSELLLAIIHAAAGTPPRSTVAGYRRIGAALTELATVPVKELIEFTMYAALTSRHAALARFDAVAHTYPPLWRRQIARYRKTLTANTRSTAFFLPIEFRTGRAQAQGFTQLRTFLGNFGELMHAWPEIWRQVRL